MKIPHTSDLSTARRLALTMLGWRGGGKKGQKKRGKKKKTAKKNSAESKGAPLRNPSWGHARIFQDNGLCWPTPRSIIFVRKKDAPATRRKCLSRCAAGDGARGLPCNIGTSLPFASDLVQEKKKKKTKGSAAPPAMADALPF